MSHRQSRASTSGSDAAIRQRPQVQWLFARPVPSPLATPLVFAKVVQRPSCCHLLVGRLLRLLVLQHETSPPLTFKNCARTHLGRMSSFDRQRLRDERRTAPYRRTLQTHHFGSPHYNHLQNWTPSQTLFAAEGRHLSQIPMSLFFVYRLRNKHMYPVLK
jgi:hypothetical protein